uniref:Alcohol dehydrogenase-like C-terminal domain-containing protein n=1 Tax=Ananas comosus var. bracteatus TaxID=296719 RepID=A0A6V7QVG6_ANACO
MRGRPGGARRSSGGVQRPQEALRIEEVVVAPPEDHEVRIKILCTSLCHSDLTFWRMKDFPGIFPRIFGHEAVGAWGTRGGAGGGGHGGPHLPRAVRRHGGGLRGLPLGAKQHVLEAPVHGDAGDAEEPRPRRLQVHGRGGAAGAPLPERVELQRVHRGGRRPRRQGGPHRPPEKACLLSCGASTGIGAAGKVAGVEAGSTVAIFGLGAVGLAVAEGARIRGASRIIGVDLNPDKFELGKKFGLTDFINPKELGDRSISEVIIEMTNGGADYCFECIGLASVMKDAFQSSRQGWGKTIILGVEMHGAPLCVAAGEILWGKCIMGSLFGGIKPKIDIPIFVKQYLNKELQLDEFITHEIGFEDINKAFDLLVEGKSLRCTIWMDK